MSAVHLVFLLASLLAFSTAAPAPTLDECSQLNQTLTREELDKILGVWILIEAVSDSIVFSSVLERLGSYVIVVNTTGDNNTLVFDQATPVPRKDADKSQNLTMDRECGKSIDHVTFVSDKFLEVYMKVSSTKYSFLRTCQDFMLMHTDTRVVNYQALYFFGRNTTAQASDLETFWKQAACLQFPLPPPFHYDPSKGLCPV